MQYCTVCTHPEREAIEVLLVEGEPERNIAARFGLSPAAVHRHKVKHLPEKLLEAKQAKYLLSAKRLFDKVEGLVQEAENLIEHAKTSTKADTRAWASGIREARSCLELLTKLSIAQSEKPDAFDKVTMGPTEWREYILAMYEQIQAEKTPEEIRNHEEAMWRKVEIQTRERTGLLRLGLDEALGLMTNDERKTMMHTMRRVYNDAVLGKPALGEPHEDTPMVDLDQVLEALKPEERKAVLRVIRREISRHPSERETLPPASHAVIP